MADDILINGEPATQLPVQDRGLHYGDGLFETIAVQGGQLLCMADHLERLLVSCQQLKLPFTQDRQLRAEAESLARDVGRAVIKIIITRGSGGRGYAPPVNPQPTRIVACYPWPEFPAETIDDGIAVRVCDTRYGHQPLLAGMKHLNRLEQVMARAEWDDPAIAEGVVLDIDDNVIEGTMSNIFYASNGKLFTPDLKQCGIKGIIRQKIVDLAEDVAIKQISLPELLDADEVFVCNSIIGLWPVTRINDRKYKVGSIGQNLRDLLIKQEYIGH